jgi:hypothetical protein
MKYILLTLIVLGTLNTIDGQTIFTFGHEQLFYVKDLRIAKPVLHDAPVTSDDHPWIKLFKLYFNPGSFEAYKSFFTNSDWPGISKAAYDEWQRLLKNNKLTLQYVIQVRDKEKNEFLVFQYVMETSSHLLYQSKVMKKVNGAWKHRNIENNQLTVILEQLGSTDTKFITQKIDEKQEQISLAPLNQNQIRSYQEKFDREKVFSSISETLVSYKASQEDIQIAGKLFIDRDDQAMVQYLARALKMDDVDLMKAINEKCGFTLFTYIRSTESK